MYLAGVSVCRVEDITEALWGTRVSPGAVSNLKKKIYAKIDEWRNRPITGTYPYLYFDGIVKKRPWAGEVRNVSLLVASAVNFSCERSYRLNFRHSRTCNHRGRLTLPFTRQRRQRSVFFVSTQLLRMKNDGA